MGKEEQKRRRRKGKKMNSCRIAPFGGYFHLQVLHVRQALRMQDVEHEVTLVDVEYAFVLVTCKLPTSASLTYARHRTWSDTRRCAYFYFYVRLVLRMQDTEHVYPSASHPLPASLTYARRRKWNDASWMLHAFRRFLNVF